MYNIVYDLAYLYELCFARIYIYAGEHLGAMSTLPYLSPQLNGEQLLVGANFASAGIGILNDTGIQFVRNPMLVL